MALILVFTLSGSSPKGDLDLRRAAVTVELDKLDQRLIFKLSTLLNRVPVLNWIVPDVAADGRVRPQNEIEAEVFRNLMSVPDVRITKLNDRGERDILCNQIVEWQRSGTGCEQAGSRFAWRSTVGRCVLRRRTAPSRSSSYPPP